MSLFRRIINAIVPDRAMAARIDEEMGYHVEMRAAENRAKGMSAEAAMRAARLAFGNVTSQAESTREAHAVRWLEQLVRDLRLAVRSLRRQPALVVTAIGSLALGIGVNSAIFSVLDAVALRSLPIPNLSRLYAINETKDGESTTGNPLRLADWGEQVTGFAAVTGYYGESPLLTAPGEPRKVAALRTFGDFFGVLGTSPIAGRGFTAEERRGEPVAVIRRGAATRWFGTVEGAIGRAVTLDGAGYTVVGVVPEDVHPGDVDVWLPAPGDLQKGPRVASYLFTIALLRGDRASATVAGELAVVQERLGKAYPETDAGRTATLEPLQAALTGSARSAMLVVQGIALVVLAIACLNLAGLLLARAGSRQRESAIRSALGAGQGSLVRLYLTESLLLGLLGAAGGIAVAAGLLPVIRSLELPVDLPRLAGARLDGRALGMAVILALGSLLLFGAAPALAAARGSLVPQLGRSAPRQRLRGAVVAAQAGLAIVLLLAAGALVQGVRRLDRDRAFSSAGVLTVRIGFSWDSPSAAIHGFAARALESFAAIPGVTAVGLTDRLPLDGETQSAPVTVAGRELPPATAVKKVSVRAVSAGYFAAMAIPFRDGRTLADRGTAVVNEAFAREWLGDRALGRRVTVFGDRTVEVVGVVAGVRQSAEIDRVTPEIFIDARETFWPMMVFLLRTSGEPSALAAAVRARVRDIDPALMIDGIAPMEQALVRITRTPRLLSTLVIGFAAIAVGLVAIGLSGLLTGYVNQRLIEIGVRLAIGATPAAIVARVAGHGFRLVASGLLVGVIGWGLFGGLLRRLPVAVEPAELGLLGVGVVTFLLLAGAACLAPAWRAARIDPVTALRAD